MKKIIAFLLIALSATIAFTDNNSVSGETTTTGYVPTTTLTETSDSAVYSYEGGTYYFQNYDELLSQIYEDVHDDLYQEVYDLVMSQIDTQFYEDIYSSVEAQLVDMLSEEDIAIYLGELQDQIHDVVAIGEQSAFGVETYLPDDGSYVVGSGVVYKYDSVNQEYYLITNHHVINDYLDFIEANPSRSAETAVEVVFADRTKVEAEILGYDTEVDIAILRFSATGLEDQNIAVAELADSYEEGDIVIAVGNPLGFDYYNSATMGIISGVNRSIDADSYVGYIQHDAAINHGNSGGPLYNLAGQVVGINVAKFATIDIEGMGFSIPIELVKEIIQRIENNDLEYHTIKPRMAFDYAVVEDLFNNGQISLSSLTIGSQTHNNITLDLPSGLSTGLVVLGIESQTTLDGYLTNGDILVSVDGYQITDSDSFYEYLFANYEAGDTVSITYYDLNPSTLTYGTTLQTINIELI